MVASARALNRATLARQMLLHRENLAVDDALRRLVALQAQHPASPYIALWNRLAEFDAADLDAAFAEGVLVKATLFRITLHALYTADYAAFHQAMQPTTRGAGLGDKRYTTTGLTPADADELLPELLELVAEEPKSGPELEAWLAERLAVSSGSGVWRAFRCFAPLLRAPSDEPWKFSWRPTFVAAGTPPASTDREVADAALAGVITRYLAAFGPASVADVAQYTLAQKARVRAALKLIDEEVDRLDGPDGVELLDVPGAARPSEDAPAPPRLLPMWDNVLFAYADRSRVIPSDYRKLVIRNNGDSLPTLLVDGYVAGVWRPVDDGIEATAFHGLSDDEWEGLATEAASLRKLIADREPNVYRRYDRWWSGLPAADVRVLPG